MATRYKQKTAPRLGRETWLYEDWKASLPFNLRTETNDYDLYGAYLSGAKPTLEDDGQYHLPSRDPYTGRILKRPNHPTFRQALEVDHRLGYEPVWRNGEVYTVKRNQKAYGSELPAPLHSPNIYELAARRAKAKDGLKVNWRKALSSTAMRQLADSYVANQTVAKSDNTHVAKKLQVNPIRRVGDKLRQNSTSNVNYHRTQNTTSTAKRSMQYEDKMQDVVNKRRKVNNYRTKDYDIPYGSKIITVRMSENAPLKSISVNALDSVAKYAGITHTPIQTALGLPTQETDWGRAPFFNIADVPANEQKAFANANYFKAFGSIPQEYLVRDFKYNDDMYGGKSLTPLSTPPLQHAFEYFNSGNYNRGDKNHTSDVKAKGNALWHESTGNLRRWWNTEGKYWYNKGQ